MRMFTRYSPWGTESCMFERRSRGRCSSTVPMVPTTLLLASLAFPQGTDTLSSTAAANRELVIGVDAFRYIFCA